MVAAETTTKTKWSIDVAHSEIAFKEEKIQLNKFHYRSCERNI